MRHTRQVKQIRLLSALLAALPLTASAAGLGKLTVLSAIGQPLRAEVELSASKDELASMTARLASPEAFRKAGIDYSAGLTGVSVSVDKRGSRSVLKVFSDRPVNETFLDVLIELNWSSGRLQREYTFLLDPADMPAPAPVAPVAVPESRPAPRPAAAAPVPARVPESTGYEVKRGDTLRKISAEIKPESATLDQMLVALFRANPEAFDGNNMNRLRAGRILTVPDAAEVTAVAPDDAQRIVSAQTADFSAFRGKLAATVAAAPSTTDRSGQSSSGRIQPQVQDAAPVPANKQDQLQVSKTAEAKPTAGRLSQLEEDVVAKERALKDANARLAELERNVKELQRLLELKSQNLADMQKGGKPAGEPTMPPPEPPKPAAPAADKAVPDLVAEAAKPDTAAAEGKGVPDLVDEAAKPDAPAPALPKEPEPPKPEAQQPVAPPPAPAPVAQEEPGFIGELLGSSGMLAALAAIIAGGLGYVGYKRRKPSAPEPVADANPSTTAGVQMPPMPTSVIGATGAGQSVDTSASSIQTDFSQSSLSSIDADEGVDPVAEADVYMAYGRDAQAEEILLEALKSEPSRYAIHLKLLEIYAQRKSAQQFDALASELYAQTGGKGAEWEKAALLGRKLDPSNPLYGGEAVAEPEAEPEASTAETVVISPADKLRDTWTMPTDLGQLAAGNEPTVVMQPEEVPKFEPEPEPVSQPEAASSGLDFDLELGSPEPTPVVAAAAVAGVATTLTRPDEAESGPSSLDFDLGLDFTSKDESTPSVSTVLLEKNAAETAEALVAGESPVFDVDLSAPSDEAAQSSSAEPEDVAVVDLERTDIGNLIDFNFDVGGAEHSEPALDLSDIDLDLEPVPDAAGELPVAQPDATLDIPALPAEERPAESAEQTESTVVLEQAPVLPEPDNAEDEMDAAASSTVINPEDALLATAPGGMEALVAMQDEGGSAAEEAETKLELARAYEEMGDKEGARELLQEVMKDGTAEQQARAGEMLNSLG